jgi:hypothetical protein
MMLAGYFFVIWLILFGLTSLVSVSLCKEFLPWTKEFKVFIGILIAITISLIIVAIMYNNFMDGFAGATA